MLKVYRFKCLKDNYGFLIHDATSNKVICIDTPDGNEIIKQAHSLGLKIDEIWNTHWHPDHAGGNELVKQEFNAIIKGPSEVAAHNYPLDVVVKPNQELSLGDNLVKTMDLSGHTLGQIGYYFPADNMVFVGDALFVLGCGRLFEGDAKMAYEGMERLKSLPPITKVYCAHEYSAANAKFCRSLGLSNKVLKEYIEEIETKTAQNISTVPTNIAKEIAANPFLLADYDNLKYELGLTGKKDYEIFAYIRKLKDEF